ncbi:MAG: hypothetical protein SFZ23_15820, partial [Planctomycetota bacterium]|nr:hypothetical protein [Planctomycetota bacterium]
GRTLTISGTTFTNNASVNATAGTTSIAPTTFTNAAAGTLTATGASTILTIGNSSTTWTSPGAISLNTATVNLGGTFNSLNTSGLSRTGGTLNLTGSFNNPGVLALTASTGSLRLNGGTINNGSVTYAGGSALTFANTDSTLNNVAVNGELFLNETSATATIRGTTTFTGVRLAGGSSRISFTQATYTLSVPIIAEGPGTGARTVTFGVGIASTVTIASSGSIVALAGTGGININQSSLSTLVNNGLISNSSDGSSNSIAVNVFTNNGTLEVLGLNASLNLNSTPTLTNFSAGTLTGGVWIARNGSDFFTSTGGNITTIANATVELSGTNARWDQLLTLSTIASNASFTLDANADLTFTPAGGTFLNNGQLTLGEGSTLSVNGAVTLAPGSTLNVQAAGVSETTGFGRVVATGVLTLGGSFAFTEVNGFNATYFDNFEFGVGSSRVGTFSSISLPVPLVDGKNFMIYTTNSVKVAISAIPDFNEDGLVDFFDYLDFVDRWSNDDPSGDFNGDGSVDFFDFLDFADYFSRFA